ncbi:amidohydrolase [Parvularcula dongshanensis]|uniref:Hippurate hydrolase n=1 Tax=Parvularcula dongshanensis TaxID=1173995 RepID=A0A840I6W2_9PROT|nr:amidohydrolase [Parvularcula dongshanensis]MBB4659730.1 hippurate hydrolase [Parvularcula dongshanensis]
MIRPLLGASALVLALATPAFAQDGVTAAVEGDYDYLEALYKDLHRNPELSFQEKETSKRLARELKKAGYDVTTGVGGTGVVAVMKNGEGPTVLVRADMDGLPVKEETGLPYASEATGPNREGEVFPTMHACGHDVHMTSLVGAARRLAEMRDSWSGTLVLIGQPAEEIGLGAVAMIEDGLYERFPKPDVGIALHDSASLPAGQISYTPGYALANVDSVDIHVKGVGGHGAYPHTTVDPVVIGARIVDTLQTLVSREISPLDRAVITVGAFNAGTKHNIIPPEAHLQITVRSFDDATREKLLSGIKRIAEAQARSAGLEGDMLPTVTVEEPYTPSTYNDPDLTGRVAGALRRTFGEDRVREVPPVMGGEDFSQFTRMGDDLPTVIFWIGAVPQDRFAAAQESGEALPSLHSPFFAPDPRPTLLTGASALTAAALDLLSTEEVQVGN